MQTKTTRKEGTSEIRIAGKGYSLSTAGANGSPKRTLPKGSDCTKIAAARQQRPAR